MNTISAKPILKWAGGKSQLLEQISRALPNDVYTGEITRYAEPFIGGGAVFFHVARNYHIQQFYLSDQNPELTILYISVQRQVDEVIQGLWEIQNEYFSLSAFSGKNSKLIVAN